MKLRCPSCGAIASADAYGNDGTARETLAVLLKLPAPLPPVILNYLALFRPAKSAQSWGKALNVAKDFQAMIATGTVQAKGQVARPCPPRIWAAAIDTMVAQRDTIKRPLKNHNYLIQIAWGLADKEDARREQTQRENELNGGFRPPRRPKQDKDGLTPFMKQYKEKFGHLPGEEPEQTND